MISIINPRFSGGNYALHAADEKPEYMGEKSEWMTKEDAVIPNNAGQFDRLGAKSDITITAYSQEEMEDVEFTDTKFVKVELSSPAEIQQLTEGGDN